MLSGEIPLLFIEYLPRGLIWSEKGKHIKVFFDIIQLKKLEYIPNVKKKKKNEGKKNEGKNY